MSVAKRRERLLWGALITWLITLFLLGGWWAHLMYSQAERISQLETQLGQMETTRTWVKTQRMLLWESSTFFTLLIGSTAGMAWLYWRDRSRARAVQAFFASVTHELRTPLTSIRLQAETLLDRITKKDQPNSQVSQSDRTLLARLLEDTSRLESQVERTLELARLEGGGPITTDSFSLRGPIERAVEQWSESNPQSLRVQLSGITDDPWVQGDAAAIHVIVKNLLENSMRHSGLETVDVKIKIDPPGGSNGHVTLVYEDNGRGFGGTPKDQKRLGELFYRGPRSQGAGVGLYLVRTLMRRMGGNAEFGSPETQGQGFRARLVFICAHPAALGASAAGRGKERA